MCRGLLDDIQPVPSQTEGILCLGLLDNGQHKGKHMLLVLLPPEDLLAASDIWKSFA